MQQARLVRSQLLLGADLAIVGVDEYDPLAGRQAVGLPPGCTKRQPKRPLMQRLPRVIELSSGEVDFTIAPSCSCSVSVHPTPQYGQMVSVVDWRDSFQVPSCRMSNSVFAMSAPVGHTAMQLP